MAGGGRYRRVDILQLMEWRNAWISALADAGYAEQVQARLKDNVQRSEHGCWEWQRHLDRSGYGMISVKSAMVRAHQVALTINYGPWPIEYQVDHLCRNRKCCNPEHLELVTPAENSARGRVGFIGGMRQLRKTHCPQGHPYDEANTYVHHRHGGRACRQCRREGMRRAYRRSS